MQSVSRQAAGLIRRIRDKMRPDPDDFLRSVSGVIHVGANVGQERSTYESLGLRVLWVEPIPDIFAALSANIATLPRQRALQALLTDKDDVEYQFHVASNEGASSSILEFGRHPEIWPDIRYEATLTLRSRTLPSLLRDAGVHAGDYDALILDTQGSELLVLQGAEPVLGSFAYIKVEAADFESYVGGAQVADIASYLERHGFTEFRRRKFAEGRGREAYFDLVFSRP